MQLLSLSLQETGIPDVRANYQELRKQEKRSRLAQGPVVTEGNSKNSPQDFTSTPSISGFPEGYKYDEKSRRAFKLHKKKKSWQDAQQTCQNEGGNLITVDTPEINNILKSKKELIWIGASDLKTEGTFAWTNGKIVWKNGNKLSYSNWMPGEPNDHAKNEDCTEVNYGQPGQWNDRPCSQRHYFMCEIDDRGKNDI